MTKSAQENLVRNLAVQNAPYGITVEQHCPGPGADRPERLSAGGSGGLERLGSQRESHGARRPARRHLGRGRVSGIRCRRIRDRLHDPRDRRGSYPAGKGRRKAAIARACFNARTAPKKASTQGPAHSGGHAMLDRRTFNAACRLGDRARAAAPMAAFGQTPANVARNKTLIVAGQVEAPVYRNVGQANPYSINNEDFRVSIINMFEPLFYYNSNKNEVIPWVASSLENAPDFSSYTVKLRDGVTWSDGRPSGRRRRLHARDADRERQRQEGSHPVGGCRRRGQGGRQARPPHRQDRSDRAPIRASRSNTSSTISISACNGCRPISGRTSPIPAGFSFFDLAKGWPVTTGPWKVTRFTDNQIFMDRRPEWWAAKAGLVHRCRRWSA